MSGINDVRSRGRQNSSGFKPWCVVVRKRRIGERKAHDRATINHNIFKRTRKYIHGVEKKSKRAINMAKSFRKKIGKQKFYAIVIVRQSGTMVWKTVIKKKVN
jgi:hypothetical protein